MRCRAATRCLKRLRLQLGDVRGFTTSRRQAQSRTIPTLPDWDVERFRLKAFQPPKPAKLPANDHILEQAQQKWFSRSSSDAPVSLNHDFWSTYHDVLVPLELTSTVGGEERFEAARAPLGTFLEWVKTAESDTPMRIYLAQCQLADLPQQLRDDVPTPELVLKAGKGDIYDTNLWMGLAPTYTPLHRDPNPNLFLQLAGTKTVRLYPPEVGAAIFEAVQEELGQSGSSVFRGEEMMQGREKEVLEREVWEDSQNDGRDGHQATLTDGEALFIPLGWWHSIRGMGTGLTASVNWWFR